MTGPHDQVGVVTSILTDKALAYFEAGVDEQTHQEDEHGDLQEVPLTTAMVDQALKAMSGAIFPHRALENQKLWMRRHLKKPPNMPYRLLESKVLRMNAALPFFPGGENDATRGSFKTACPLFLLLPLNNGALQQ